MMCGASLADIAGGWQALSRNLHRSLRQYMSIMLSNFAHCAVKLRDKSLTAGLIGLIICIQTIFGCSRGALACMLALPS